jgi:DNA-binding transcriptional ArsR family regulator
MVCSIADDDVETVLLALADPTRRRVVELLGAGPRRSSELAAAVGMPRTALSRHLKVLRSSGLVSVETVADDARGRIYSLDAEQLVAVRAWLDQVSASWTEQLGRFKAHAERRRR